ncbi:MAG: carboxypeptidase-like regulatory domain-containing protein, partial [Oscillospiraceae bacterium]
MKNFKKILCVVLAALMVSSSLVACKKKPSKPNGDTSSTSSQTKATGINVVGYMKNTDGTPLSGVTLQFGTDGKHAAVTDENGYFLFSGVEAGKYTLELLSSGMSMAKQEVTIVLGEVEAVADNVFTTDKNGIALNITLSGSGFVFELNTDIKVPETSSDTSSASGSGNGSGSTSNSSNVSNPNSSPVDESGKVDRTAVWTGDQNFKPGKYYGNLPKSQFRDGAGSDLTYGLWCWSTSLFMPDAANNEAGMDINMLLDMCIQNKFNEIYLSMLSKLQTADQIDKVGADSGKYSEMALRGFIKKCSEYGIKVYALEGEGGQGALKWFEPSDKRTEKYIETIKKVNANAKSDSEKIAGLHLDVEAPLNDGAPTSPVSKQRYQKAMDYFVRTAASCKE